MASTAAIANHATSTRIVSSDDTDRFPMAFIEVFLAVGY